MPPNRVYRPWLTTYSPIIRGELIGMYQKFEAWWVLPVCTSVPISCRYGTYQAVPNYTEHTDKWYIGAYWCTVYTGSLSNWYVSPVPSGMANIDLKFVWGLYIFYILIGVRVSLKDVKTMFSFSCILLNIMSVPG